PQTDCSPSLEALPHSTWQTGRLSPSPPPRLDTLTIYNLYFVDGLGMLAAGLMSDAVMGLRMYCWNSNFPDIKPSTWSIPSGRRPLKRTAAAKTLSRLQSASNCQ